MLPTSELEWKLVILSPKRLPKKAKPYQSDLIIWKKWNVIRSDSNGVWQDGWERVYPLIEKSRTRVTLKIRIRLLEAVV